MIAALDHLEDSDLLDKIFYNLCLSEELARYCLDRFQSLNSDQAKCVAHFLKFCVSVYDESEFNVCDVEAAEKSLNSYWGQFLVN